MKMTNIPQSYIELFNVADEYKDDAYQYCLLVLTGKYVTCKETKQACVRHLKDLQRIDTDDSFHYVYKPIRAKKVIKFIEALPDTKGKFHKLGLFQKFIVASVRGWFHEDTDTLRFKKASITCSRKQGKSILISGMTLYSFIFDREPKEGRQIFCAANDKKQASIVFNMVANRCSGLYHNVLRLRKSLKKSEKN